MLLSAANLEKAVLSQLLYQNAESSDLIFLAFKSQRTLFILYIYLTINKNN